MACVHRATLPNFTVNHSFIFVFRKTSNSRLLSSPARFWGKKKTNTKSSDNDVAQSSIMNDDEPCEMARVENHFKCRKLIYTDLQIHICIYVHMLVVICQNYKFVFFFFIYMRFLHWIWYSLHFLLILFFLYCSLKFYQYQYFMVLYQFLNMWIFIFFIYFVIIFSI